MVAQLCRFDTIGNYYTMCIRNGALVTEDIKSDSDWHRVWGAAGNIVFHLHEDHEAEPLPLFLDGIRRPVKCYRYQIDELREEPYVAVMEDAMSALLEGSEGRYLLTLGVTSGIYGKPTHFNPCNLPHDIEYFIVKLLGRLLGNLELANPRANTSDY